MDRYWSDEYFLVAPDSDHVRLEYVIVVHHDIVYSNRDDFAKVVELGKHLTKSIVETMRHEYDSFLLR